MFKHQGLAEEDAYPPLMVWLSSMTPDMRVVECPTSHARRLQVGYVLQHDDKQELVQVLGIVIGGSQSYIELQRGWNGTEPMLHASAYWKIQIVPYVDFRSAAEKEADRIEQEHAALSWNCTNCGGPNYNTDICRWCGRHQ